MGYGVRFRGGAQLNKKNTDFTVPIYRGLGTILVTMQEKFSLIIES
jgi:hypothetical protein